ncbi:ThiF family adenylyltransferase [Aliiglaciecola litoralis]|uniref:ThiF family adenylyltransferase n=1 Tax=Aliiglaciecola litoralis TaxID=582857 RepID=A0ABN1LEM0_9ALTE
MFDYHKAFKRNLGWITPEEQEKIRNATFAVGGLGGVGGDHAITMARMGAQNFHIADLDDYDYSNFNRQAGANVDTVGIAKSQILEETIKAINPDANIKNFTNGIQKDNVDEFLDGVDVYLDSLDIFAVEIRRLTFQKCHEKNIPALTAGPMGMGVAFMAFLPGKGMSFADYFGMNSPCPKFLEKHKDDPVAMHMHKLEVYIDNIIRFVVGVGPTVQQRHYLMDKSKVDFFTKDLPSTKMGIDLASGTLCTNVIKLVVNRGKVICAPRGLHFDAFHNNLEKTWRPGGHANPMLQFIRRFIKGQFKINEKLDWIRKTLNEQQQQGRLKESYSEEEMYNMLMEFDEQRRNNAQ